MIRAGPVALGAGLASSQPASKAGPSRIAARAKRRQRLGKFNSMFSIVERFP